MATKTNSTINGRDYYRIRRTVGHKLDKNGELIPIKKSFYGKSKRDAEKQYDAWKDEQRERKDRRIKDRLLISFGDLANTYTENVLKVSNKYAPGTIDRYDSAYRNWIVPDKDLCSITIGDLTAMDLQKYYNRLSCPPTTMKQIHKYMTALFKWLVMQGYCTNIHDVVEMPRVQQIAHAPQVITWTDEELETIISSLRSYRNGRYRLRLFIMMASMTGMRIGELFGLQYSDIESGSINIQRQVHNGTIRPPKSNSYRQIPILPALQNEIDFHREWHDHERTVKRYDSNFVFTTTLGLPLEYGNTRRSINRFYNRIGIEPKKFHTYRSTFCTMLCRNGVPIQIASRLLGHKSIEVTSKYYTDVDIEDKRNALSMLRIV